MLLGEGVVIRGASAVGWATGTGCGNDDDGLA